MHEMHCCLLLGLVLLPLPTPPAEPGLPVQAAPRAYLLPPREQHLLLLLLRAAQLP